MMKRIAILYIWIKYSIISYLNMIDNLFIPNIISSKPLGDKNFFDDQKKILLKNKSLIDFKESGLDTDFFIELGFTNQISFKKSENDISHGLIIYHKLKKYISESKQNNFNILDLGTAKGFSSICLAKAIKDTNSQGKVISIDIIPHNKKMYWNSPNDFLGRFTREETLSKYKEYLKYIIYIQNDSTIALKTTHLNRIHFSFIDADHNYKKILSDIKIISSLQYRGDIIIFDDYDDYKGVNKAISDTLDIYNYSLEEIIKKPNFRKKLAVLIKN